MLHVLITIKPSLRYPGKNARLIGYTIAWLAMEILHTPEEVRVYTVGTRSELPEEMPRAWRHIECSTGSHQGDLAHAEEVVQPAPDDVLILAQPTQPLRRLHLLGAVAELARIRGSAVTACTCKREDWRALSLEGTWEPDKGHHALLYDGALYGWQPGKLAAIFSPSTRHGVAVNYAGRPVDVDDASDVPPALPGAFAEVLLSDYLCRR